MIERAQHASATFVTLTYSDENLRISEQSKLASLHPPDVKDWLKRLRTHVAENFNSQRLRFYAVGEYSDEWRPHYHVALFGYPNCEFGQSSYSKRRLTCCAACELVRSKWRLGNIFLGNLERDSAGYICQYVTKKMTAPDDVRLNGRHPEFARMSLDPGIGASGTWDIASVLLAYDVLPAGDVPSTLRHGTTKHPLGRYLTRLVRTRMGQDPRAPDHVLKAIADELLPLRLDAKASEENPSFKKRLVDKGEGARASQLARSKIYKQKGKL